MEHLFAQLAKLELAVSELDNNEQALRETTILRLQLAAVVKATADNKSVGENKHRRVVADIRMSKLIHSIFSEKLPRSTLHRHMTQVADFLLENFPHELYNLYGVGSSQSAFKQLKEEGLKGALKHLVDEKLLCISNA